MDGPLRLSGRARIGARAQKSRKQGQPKKLFVRNASLPRRLENNGSDYAKQQVLTYDHCGLEYQQVCQCLGN